MRTFFLMMYGKKAIAGSDRRQHRNASYAGGGLSLNANIISRKDCWNPSVRPIMMLQHGRKVKEKRDIAGCNGANSEQYLNRLIHDAHPAKENHKGTL